MRLGLFKSAGVLRPFSLVYVNSRSFLCRSPEWNTDGKRVADTDFKVQVSSEMLPEVLFHYHFYQLMFPLSQMLQSLNFCTSPEAALY